MSTLELRGVGHRFAGAASDTLHGVDLVVEEGGLLAVVGPSGSGKTTLLRVAAGLEQPGAGQVRLDGTVVTHLPPERREVTMMFQEPHLFGHLDVTDNVAFGPRTTGTSRREARRRAARYLALVHLDGLGPRRPGRLSGGQQQRVALARALATERGVLLLDEPFSALDPDLRASMHDLLDEVRAALAPTTLMVTHDLDEAALADRVAVLVEGRVQQVDTVGGLYARPATAAVARLLGGFTMLEGTVRDGAHRGAGGAVALPAGAVPDGPATLLLRREDLRLAGPSEHPAPGWRLAGTVTGARRRGPRLAVVVEPDAGAPRVEVELPAGDHDEAPRPGTACTVLLADGARGWAVAAGTGGEPAEEPASSPSPAR